MDTLNVFKRFFNALGVDVVRLKNVPRVTFLGLGSRHFGCVLDVGANNGGFAKWITNILPGVVVHCFEPLPSPAEQLRIWADKCDHAHVIVHQIAVSDFNGEAPIMEHVDHLTSSSMLKTTAEGVVLYPFTARTAERMISVLTLDSWVAAQSRQFSRILLKIDVQGLEDRVLRGGVRTLMDVDVCIVEVSIARIYEGQASFADLVGQFQDAGLSYFGNLEQIHDRRGEPLSMDCVFVR